MLSNILYLILFASFELCSSTFLWRIETTPPAYIFGTIHVPYNLIWPYVSNKTRRAFLSSTHFYGEIDAIDDTFWDDFLRCVENKSRRTRRSSDSNNESAILDVYLFADARRLNKTVGSLETPKYHCEREYWRYNVTTWRILMNFIKREMKTPRFSLIDWKFYSTKSMIKNYICDGITDHYINNLMKLTNYSEHTEQRDEQMSRRIHTLLHRSNNNRYFFAVGAAHMLGKHQNLIVQLKKFGYKITRICTNRNRIKKQYGCEKKKIPKHCIKKND